MASFSVTTDGQLSIGTGIGDITAVATTVAAAQQFGSALYTRYTHRPLQELIYALNDDLDIVPRRYHGTNIYDEETGIAMTMQGEIKAMAMNKLVLAGDAEKPTHLGTIIICLSVAMSKLALSPILASAIMLYVHGVIEKSMEGTISALQNKIEKYATAVLSRDSMCNKRENARANILNMVRTKAPYIAGHTLFLPPRTPSEEGDFAELLVDIMSAKADGVKIYTRSLKLLGLALLLTQYGWEIDVFVENETLEIVPIIVDTALLSVIYSSAPIQREYVENHNRYNSMSRSEFYSTAICPIINIGEVSGLSISNTEKDQRCFMLGYKIIERYWNQNLESEIHITLEGLLSMTSHIRTTTGGKSPVFIHERDCRSIVGRFLSNGMPDAVQQIVVDALGEAYPLYDWGLLHEAIGKQKNSIAWFMTLLSTFDGNTEKLWTVCGAAIGALDKIILSLVNFSRFVGSCYRHFDALFNTGLDPGDAVLLCASRLAGVDEDNSRMATGANSKSAIGYWNAQQGILLTPVFERSLYCDLPQEKARPLTFFNIPIIGMPTDDGGWIRPGIVDSPNMRLKNNFSVSQPQRCNVVIEYRPHFEPQRCCCWCVSRGEFLPSASPQWHAVLPMA
jgi:hypothetical protein